MRVALSLAAMVVLVVPMVSLGARRPAMVSADRLELALLDQLNLVRQEAGLRPLRLNGQLAAAARYHSFEMLRTGYFAHESADGSAFWLRIRRFYRRLAGRRWSVGENLLWRSRGISPGAAVRAWLESSEHRANLLRARYREVGISAVRAIGAPGVYGGGRVVVLTLDFGAR